MRLMSVRLTGRLATHEIARCDYTSGGKEAVAVCGVRHPYRVTDYVLGDITCKRCNGAA